jgi:hypothetical protein
MLDKLVTEVLSRHWPKPPLPSAERQRLLTAIPFSIPQDLAYFFTKCNGATLFDPDRSRYMLVGVEGFHPTRFDIFGRDEDAFGPAGLFTVCDVQDGNFVALDLSHAELSRCPTLDCFHETFGDPSYQLRVIAESFTDFLARALDSANKLYWL